MKNENTNHASIGVTGLLLVAFVVLKLCHVIEWPWVWVLAPAWIPLAIVIVIIVSVLFYKGVIKS